MVDRLCRRSICIPWWTTSVTDQFFFTINWAVERAINPPTRNCTSCLQRKCALVATVSKQHVSHVCFSLHYRYSIQESVTDLHHLLEKLEYSKVHLLGHSYGGVVALEFTRKFPEYLQSLILSNAPTSMKMVLEEYNRLESENPQEFWETHACRMSTTPVALQDAIQNVGTIWRGMGVVVDYVARPLEKTPPILVIRGQHDFGELASEGWKHVLTLDQEVILENCAHYPHLEDGATFGALVTGFMLQHDNDI